MEEKKIQQQILQYLRSLGSEVWFSKTIVATARGVPDILVCYRGRFIAFEVKGSRGVVSMLQNRQISLINDAGGVARVVYSLEDVKSILSELQNG